MRFRLFLLLTLLSVSSCKGILPGRRTSARELDAIAQTYKQGDPKTAAEKLKEYLKGRPQDDTAWTILGHAHGELNEDQAAEDAYRRALEINPKRFEAVTGMGILARKKGNYDQALSYYEKALAIDPKYAQAYSSMTVIALRQRRDAQALEYAGKGYDLDPSDPTIVANLAVAYHYNGMFEQRDKMTEQAKSLGYAKAETLRKIYSGEMSVRD